MKKPPLSAATLWQLHRVGGLTLAPDGRRAVCSVTRYDIEANKGLASLWLLDARGGDKPRQLTRCGDSDGQPAWSPTGERIAFVAKRAGGGGGDAADKSPQLYAIAADGGEAQRLTTFSPGVASFKWLPDGKRIVFTAWLWPACKTIAAQEEQAKAWRERKETATVTSQAFHRYWDHGIPQDRVLRLLLLDTRSGRITDLLAPSGLELQRHDGGNTDYDISPDGRHIAFVHDPMPAHEAKLGNPAALVELELRTKRARTLRASQRWDIAAPRYSGDGQRIACIAAEVGRVHTALGQLALVDRATARWQVLPGDDDLDVQGPLQWAGDDTLLFTAEQRGRCHLWRRGVAQAQSEIVQSGGTVSAFKQGADTLAYVADSALFPPRVFARPLKGQAPPRRLERFNDAVLASVALGEVREIEVTGALGDKVQCWLTFPPGFKPTRPHAVTHVIHGGPYAAAGDSFSFRWNPHVFASAGHVIAQTNFHGSSGFGHAFRHSLIGRQGELELQDIEATTSWALKQPWADPQRVFATGGSYGGFLVAWMNGHVPPGRYQAYVCHAGVFDRVSTFSADSYPVRPKDLAANWWQDMPRVLAQSPHAFARHMHTPTLVTHGALDFRVPDANGLAYYNTLNARGVQARLLWFPDENHWVLKPRNSLQWYREFAAWLTRFGG